MNMTAEEKQSMLEALQHIYDTQCIKMPIFNGDYKPVSDNTLACISYADIKSKRYNVRLISLDDYIFNRNSEMADNAEIIAKYSSLEQLVDDGWVLY